jgi:thioredoxin reductase (NADPH)
MGERDPLPETPDHDGAFPRLSEEQIEVLAPYGERRRTQPGEVLFRAGDAGYDFHVVLEGKVAILDEYGDQEHVIAVHGPRRFLGELSLLTGQAVFFTAVVREPGAVLVVPGARLARVISSDPAFGDLILRAYFLRRWQLIGLGAGFRILGSRYSPDTRRLLEFAARNRVPHRWVDLEEDEEAEAVLCELGFTPEETPVVIWRDRLLRKPSNAELARMIGLPAPRAPDGLCDLVVVGAGPGGLAAAVYGASEGLATLAFDAVATGGQAAASSRIENYLGFPTGISGGELAERATIQAEKFGATISVPAEAITLEPRDGHHVIRLDDGDQVAGRTVVIATGARYRKLPVDRLEDFEGISVHYAATQAEARMCRGDPVAVVGGGNSAGQATVFLAGQAAHVTLIVREADLSEYMSRYLADQVVRTPRVDVLLHTEVRELLGERTLQGVIAEDTWTGERRRIDARALFVFIGADPYTRWLGEELALDDGGYVLTGPDVGRAAGDGPWHEPGREPLPLETSRPGVFAVGDVRSRSTKRVASAVGEGAMAVRLLYAQVDGRGRTLAPQAHT